MTCNICSNPKRKTRFNSIRFTLCQYCVSELIKVKDDTPKSLIADLRSNFESDETEKIRPIKFLANSQPPAPIFPDEELKRASYASFIEATHQEGILTALYRSFVNNQERIKEAEQIKLKKHHEIIERHEAKKEVYRQQLISIDQAKKKYLELEVSLPNRIEEHIKNYIGYLKFTTEQLKTKSDRILRANLFGLINADKICLERPGEDEYAQLRDLIKSQDGHACVICFKTSTKSELHVHHIIPLSLFGTNNPQNLVTLCYSCHNKQHLAFKVTRAKSKNPLPRNSTFIAVNIQTTSNNTASIKKPNDRHVAIAGRPKNVNQPITTSIPKLELINKPIQITENAGLSDEYKEYSQKNYTTASQIIDEAIEPARQQQSEREHQTKEQAKENNEKQQQANRDRQAREQQQKQSEYTPPPQSTPKIPTESDSFETKAVWFWAAVIILVIWFNYGHKNLNTQQLSATTTASQPTYVQQAPTSSIDVADISNRANDLYKKGLYVEAYPLVEQMANRNYPSWQLLLGLMFVSGQGTQQNYQIAKQWYQKAADQGDADAQGLLGGMYLGGKGVAQNYTQAVYWYRKAAEQGNADAQSNLGSAYELGEGVAQDNGLAFYWRSKSAKQGYVKAQSNLGYMYQNGLGVVQDYNQAVYWYRKAAKQGNTEAMEALNILINKKKIVLSAPDKKQVKLQAQAQVRIEAQDQARLEAQTQALDQELAQTKAALAKTRTGQAKAVVDKMGVIQPDGGIVFYVDSSGLHGLEAKAADEANLLAWADAIDAVKDYGSGWRLPTSDELHLLYEKKTVVGSFATGNYWSSNKSANRTVWSQSFYDGATHYQPMDYELRVRAVRAF